MPCLGSLAGGQAGLGSLAGGQACLGNLAGGQAGLGRGSLVQDLGENVQCTHIRCVTQSKL